MVKASVIILSPHVLLPEADGQKMRGILILPCETKKTANRTAVISVSWWQTCLWISRSDFTSSVFTQGVCFEI